MKTELTIDESWDRDGNITADSDPSEEYDRWLAFADEGIPVDQGGYVGDEFTLADFEEYIRVLRAECKAELDARKPLHLEEAES
jgi:hypothetical protein